MEREKVIFSTKDLACESGLYLLSTRDVVGFWQIVASGRRYNLAKQSGDADRIAAAYWELHFELKLFKKNYLNRGKSHW